VSENHATDFPEARRGARWIVVTDEHRGSEENRKIPFVCNCDIEISLDD
jgi:hypothetical protein